MYRECPAKVMAALDSLTPQVTILKRLEHYTDPVLRLSYRPEPPSFTIRTILAAIAHSRSTPFNVSICKPVSLEDLSRKLQSREQSRLLRRLIVAVLAAIPTFVLSVVLTSLVRSGNPITQYLMEPMWAGNVSRIDWALFLLATPVMFYSANKFHEHSMKEIMVLWTRENSKSIWKRFIRFGSMNLLVRLPLCNTLMILCISSLGVGWSLGSIFLIYCSYCSRRLTAKIFRTIKLQYHVFRLRRIFDHVPANRLVVSQNRVIICLNIFPLHVGRFLEAYSKKHAADAITALSLLHPEEALLLTPKSPSEFPPIIAHDDPEKGDPTVEDAITSTKPGFKVEKVAVDLLEVGDIVRVQNGASPPADGTIVTNIATTFDESSLTGESKPVKKQVGDKVFVGTMNKSAVVDIRVDAVDGGTMYGSVLVVQATVLIESELLGLTTSSRWSATGRHEGLRSSE
jgi:Cu+-exporting ATPase